MLRGSAYVAAIVEVESQIHEIETSWYDLYVAISSIHDHGRRTDSIENVDHFLAGQLVL